MTENGSKQSAQPKKEVINDFPLDFIESDRPAYIDNSEPIDIIERFDIDIQRIEHQAFGLGEPIALMDTLYKKMELYYRIKLLRKTIKEQIEDGKV